MVRQLPWSQRHCWAAAGADGGERRGGGGKAEDEGTFHVHTPYNVRVVHQPIAGADGCPFDRPERLASSLVNGGETRRLGGGKFGLMRGMTSPSTAVRILVDADACPVKEEVYRVAFRHGAAVKVVSNARMRIPDHPLVERVVVSDAFDAADDWIADAAGPQRCGHHRGHPAGRPRAEGGGDGAGPQRQAVHQRRHRRGDRDAGDHGRSAGRGGRHRRRAGTVRQGGPIALPAGARRGAGQAKRARRSGPRKFAKFALRRANFRLFRGLRASEACGCRSGERRCWGRASRAPHRGCRPDRVAASCGMRGAFREGRDLSSG